MGEAAGSGMEFDADEGIGAGGAAAAENKDNCAVFDETDS